MRSRFAPRSARCLASRILLAPNGSFEARIDCLTNRALARVFRAEEKEVARASLHDLLAYYRAHPENARKLIATGEAPVDSALPAAELAAWTMLTNQILNMDEVLNK